MRAEPNAAHAIGLLPGEDIGAWRRRVNAAVLEFVGLTGPASSPATADISTLPCAPVLGLAAKDAALEILSALGYVVVDGDEAGSVPMIPVLQTLERGRTWNRPATPANLPDVTTVVAVRRTHLLMVELDLAELRRLLPRIRAAVLVIDDVPTGRKTTEARRIGAAIDKWVRIHVSDECEHLTAA